MLGIIGAMEEEIAILKTHMLIEKEFNKAGMTFIKGQINKKPIVLVRSGIGKVNAAMCTQILVDFFEVDAIINTGIAGAIDNVLNIGDVVISTDAIQTDFDATGFGYEAGQIPRMDTKAFKADEDLIDLLLKQCQKKKLDINVVKGRISTMDKFVSENELKNKIKRDFNAYCTEMEGAAIAHVAYLNKVKFLIIRAISDKADNSADMDYREFEQLAIKSCTNLSLALIEAL